MVEFETFWGSSGAAWHLVPKYQVIKSATDLATICEQSNWYLTAPSMSAEARVFVEELAGPPSMEMVGKAHTSKPLSPVKYFFDTVKDFPAHGFGIVVPVVISSTPVEITQGGRTIRVVRGRILATVGDGFVRDINSKHDAYFAVSTDSPYYNYLDQGHVVFFCSKVGEEPEIFIANQLSLAVYSLAAIFSVVADRVKPLLRNNTFLLSQNTPEMTRILAEAEQTLPEKMGVQYNALKQAIRADFKENAQNVLVTKFQRGELAEITLNNIKLVADRATYETISIEVAGISDVILHRLDPNAVFDIYQLVESYINSIVEETAKLPKSTTTMGFAKARQWAFRINDIPITLSVSTTNTRRKVNGHFINNEELLRVIRCATCYTDATLFDKFLRQIERASLKVHNAVSNGLPLKIYSFSSTEMKASAKHPKIFFTQDTGKYYLWLDKARTTRVPLRRFVGLLNELEMLNQKVDGGWIGDESGFSRRGSDWCQWHLKRIIREHAVDDIGNPLVTIEQCAPLIEWLLEARSEAEKKSATLLKSVVDETQAKAVKYNGLEAIEIVGNSGRSYTVEKESFKVWDTKSKEYVCIVDGRGEMGVGYDALVARLLALRNDTFVVDRIGTLKKAVQAARADASHEPAPVTQA